MLLLLHGEQLARNPQEPHPKQRARSLSRQRLVEVLIKGKRPLLSSTAARPRYTPTLCYESFDSEKRRLSYATSAASAGERGRGGRGEGGRGAGAGGAATRRHDGAQTFSPKHVTLV